jgi:hypothetical protein
VIIGPAGFNHAPKRETMSGTYKTFLRSCTDWQSFAAARKITQDTGLSYEEARRRCEDYNANRNAAQIRKGTKMEFTRE